MAKDQGRLFSVAVNEQYIYWGGDGAAVGWTELDGTKKPNIIAEKGTNEFSYWSALVGDTLYWGNDWHDLGLRGCTLPNCGGGPKTLIDTPSNAYALSYDPKNQVLYWAQADGIWREDLPGGQPTKFVGLTSKIVSQLTNDGAFLYWSEWDMTIKRTAIYKSPVSTLDVTTLVLDIAGLNGLEVFGNTLYLIEATGTENNLRGVPLPNGVGGSMPALITSAGNTSLGLAVDSGGVYWTTQEGGGSVKSCPLAGCPSGPKILALSKTPWGITTDALPVYWVTEAGAVMKIAK